MRDPMEITIGRKNEGAQNVRHIYFMVHAKDKYLALKRIVDYYPKYLRHHLLPNPERDAGNSRQAAAGRL